MITARAPSFYFFFIFQNTMGEPRTANPCDFFCVVSGMTIPYPICIMSKKWLHTTYTCIVQPAVPHYTNGDLLREGRTNWQIPAGLPCTTSKISRISEHASHVRIIGVWVTVICYFVQNPCMHICGPRNDVTPFEMEEWTSVTNSLSVSKLNKWRLAYVTKLIPA